MKKLFKNISILKNGADKSAITSNVIVENDKITYVGDTPQLPDSAFDRVICGKNRLMMPGMYNAHCHSAMTLFRGYGEDLPLDRWLHEKIFPAEDLLTEESVYAASMLAVCEMIKNGVVSFTDMYSICGETAKAVVESGIKANIGRAMLCFNPDATNADMKNDIRMIEAVALANEYHGAGNGRVKIDMSIHAEYTNTPVSCAYVADYAKKNGYLMHLHLSETEKEHNECLTRRDGMTPAEFFRSLGVFDPSLPTTAAHCVFVTDGDIEIMKANNVTAVHNPTSNLKLGSGVMRLRNLLDAGVNVALGTDGAASNNTLDIFKELHLASVVHKGIYKQADITTAEEMVALATVNGAKSQGRNDCGKIEVGYKADIVLIDTDDINMIPTFDANSALCYSANSSNVRMTMADGKILYENGEFLTVDIEKVKFDMRNVCGNYFRNESR